MSDTNPNYTTTDLCFNYLNLRKYLLRMYENRIFDVNIFLLISLEKDYYEGENLKKIIVDLIKLSNNITLNIDGKDVKFKVNKISIDVGDILNRHRWTYRYNEKYMIEHHLKDNEEDKIPKEIQQEIQSKAYETGKKQGFDWFKNHAINALNLILPQENQLKKNFKLADEITEIFKGSKNIPRIEYICYEYWLKNSKYITIEKVLNNIRNLDNSVIEKSYNHEANYYIERLNRRNEGPKFPKIFAKYSKMYLLDETVKDVMIQQSEKNNLELYYFGLEPKHNVTFNGKKAKNNITIQNYIKNELSGIDKNNWVTIRKKDERKPF